MRLLLGSFICLSFSLAHAEEKIIVVDQSGAGDFTTVQAAINSLPSIATAQRIIYIRSGVYREKIFIDKDFISLLGADRNKTILTISLSRDVWRCESPDDWGVATINLKGNDIVLDNPYYYQQFWFR
jgi:pectinesterase